MFEAVCESWQTKFKLSRPVAVLICGAIALGVGLFIEDGNMEKKDFMFTVQDSEGNYFH